MVLTILEAQVDAGREARLRAAYDAAAKGALPAGLLRSDLLRDTRDPRRWRLQTWWESQGALDAMRGAGTPAGVLMFRSAGAEPALSVFEVVDQIPRTAH